MYTMCFWKGSPSTPTSSGLQSECFVFIILSEEEYRFLLILEFVKLKIEFNLI